MVKNFSAEVSVADIVRLGLEPCRICNPQAPTRAAFMIHKVANGENRRTVQCRGITKNGTRCLHMTSIANGFCFQHQPK